MAELAPTVDIEQLKRAFTFAACLTVSAIVVLCFGAVCAAFYFWS